MFCILAGRRELVVSALLNPGLALEYLALEREVGHTFKADLSMQQIVNEAEELALSSDAPRLPAAGPSGSQQ